MELSRIHLTVPVRILIRSFVTMNFYMRLLFFFQMLLEVGFQAGQHEILADAFSKDIAQQIFEEAKQMKKNRQTNMKQSKKISDELTVAFKTMTAAKDKFRRAYEDQVRATEAYKKVRFRLSSDQKLSHG